MSKKKLIVALGGIFICLNAGVFAVHAREISGAVARLFSDEVRIDQNRYYQVTHVVDGDTFMADIGGRQITVRVLGINTPETVNPRKAVQCYGPEASAETKSLLEGRRVRLMQNPDRETRDKYGRYLLYVYRDDGLFLNEFLVKNGYAREYTVGKPYEFQTLFRNDEAAARAAGFGLWKACHAAY